MPRGANNGTELRLEEIPELTSSRFWNKVKKTRCGCWIWEDRPWVVNWKGGSGHAPSRVAWALTRGTVPAGMVVRRTCYDIRCVNPNHLALSTHAQNMGLKNCKGNFCKCKVDRIRERLLGGASDKRIAADYRVPPDVISQIRLNHTWVDPEWKPIKVRYWAKLTPEDVLDCRRRWCGGQSILSISKDQGVGYSTMWEAIHASTWKDVT